MGTTSKWFGKAIRAWVYSHGSGRRPKVGVALGGAFARGIAHIGVLRVLEQDEIPIDYIAGTSVGALIASLRQRTSLDEMGRQGSLTRFRDFGRLTLSRMGMASNERLEHFLPRFTEAKNFQQMNIPLAIVATDLLTGESVHFRKGEISPALRASCAIPAFSSRLNMMAIFS